MIRHRVAAGWTKLALLAAGASALGAQQDGDPLQNNTALVRAYAKMDQITTVADGLAKAGRYGQALNALMEAAEQNPNHLVPIKDPEAGARAQPRRYLGVVEYVRRKIAGWVASGDEARAAIAAHFDPAARSLFETAKEARDPAALTVVAEKFPFSTYADDALMLRANLEFDAGDPARAADTLEQLLDLKSVDVPLAAIYARLGQAQARAGRREDLTRLLSRADRDLGKSKLTLGGRELPVVDFLREELGRAASAPPGAEPDASWECYGGSPDGTRIVDALEVGPRAWSAPIEGARFSSTEDEMTPGRPVRPHGLPSSYRPVHPAVSEGIVYTHTEYVISAHNLYSVGAEPLWAYRQPAPPGDLMFDDRMIHTTTVADGRVFANLITWLDEYETQHHFITVKFPFPKRALFCFDAYSGAPLWRLGGQRKGDAPHETLSFSTAPTPFGGLLYVIGIRQDHQTDPFEHHVLCIDPARPAANRVLWSTFVASGGTEINLFGNSTRESIASPVAVTEGAVVVVTNHGAVASLDRRTGRIEWVARYQQLPVNPTRNVNVRRNPLEWCVNAPVVAKGQVVVAPADSRQLYGFDAVDGRKLWERQRSSGARYLYGAQGNLVIVGGSAGEASREVAVESFDLARQGALAERYVLSTAEARGAGRGVLASDGIYVPTSEGVHRIKMGSGRPVDSFQPWSTGGEGGNLVVADGTMVLASAGEVAAFFNAANVREKTRTDLERHPDDAGVVYRSGLRLLPLGRKEEARELLLKAVRLAGASARPSDARIARAARKRLYAIAMKTSKEAVQERNLAKAETALRQAREAAPEPAAALEISTALADVLIQKKDYAAAIDEYDRILDGARDDGRAFEIARMGIAVVISVAGRDVYKPWESLAEKLLKISGGTPEGALTVFRRHPNSRVAEVAILQAAAAWERLDRHDSAASAFRLFLQNFAESERVVEVQRLLVLSLERQKLFAAAAGVLRRMNRAPQAELTDDGKRVRVREFVEARLAREEYRSAASGTAAAIRVPMTRLGAYADRDFAEGAPLAVEGPPLTTAEGLIFMAYRGAVKAIDPVKGAERWRLAIEGTVRTAWSHEDSLLLCTSTAILRVNPATGIPEWRRPHGSSMNAFALTGTTLCFLAPNPSDELLCQVNAVDTARGSLLWTRTYEGVGLPKLLIWGDWVVFVSEGPARFYGYELETGRCAMSQAMTLAYGDMEILGLHQDQVFIQTPGRAVETYDLPTGRLRWRKPFEEAGLRAMDISAEGLVYVGTRSAGEETTTYLARVDLRSGKIVATRERVALDDPFELKLVAGSAMVLSRTPDGTLALRGIRLADLTPQWTSAVSPGIAHWGGFSTSGGVIIVFGGRPLERGLFDFTADLFESNGRRLQTVQGDGSYEHPPGMTLSGGAAIFSVDNRVEAWK